MNEYLNESDFTLINKSKKGNQDAMTYLVQKYQHIVSHKARKYSHQLNDFDDFYQEGLIALYEAINNFESDKEAGFPTFIEVCIDRKLTSYIRRQTTVKANLLNNATPIHEPSLINLLLTSTTTLPEIALLQKAKSIALQRCMAQNLSLQENKVIQAYLRGNTLSAISKKLSISYKSVDNAIQRSIKKLRCCIEDSI